MNKLTYLFICIVILATLLILPAISIYLLGEIPLMIPMFIILLISMKLLIPNPRKGLFISLVCAEALEHFVLPILILVSAIFFKFLWVIIFVPATCILYGYVLGEIKSNKDMIKTLLLCFILFNIIFLPDYIWALVLTYNVSGWVIWSMITLLFMAVYLLTRIQSYRRVAVLSATSITLITLTITLTLLMLSLPTVLASENELTLHHNLDYRMSIGKTDLVVTFLNPDGELVDVDKLVCEMTNPYGVKKSFSVPRISSGTYTATIDLNMPSIYYLKFLPTKEGYVFSNLETQVYATKQAHLDFSTYLLPIAFLIIIIGSVLVLRKLRKII